MKIFYKTGNAIKIEHWSKHYLPCHFCDSKVIYGEVDNEENPCSNSKGHFVCLMCEMGWETKMDITITEGIINKINEQIK